MMNKISPISFTGLKIEGVISAKNMDKLSKFATAQENTGFINDLEKTFNTDMIINSKFDEISFSHEVYGNLTDYGCPKFSTDGFYSRVVEAMNGIRHAINKAEKDYAIKKQDYEKNRRGC